MDFRKLIDWLSGGQPKETPAQPNLVEKRRYLRVHLTDSEISVEGLGTFPICNLSFGGLRIQLDENSPLPDFKSGSVIEARIKIGLVEFLTPLLVCVVTKNGVGFSFQKLSTANAKQVSDFLKPRILGVSMREISASSLICENPSLQLRWFQGDDGAQIFLWQTLDGEVVREEFYFFNYLIVWNREDNLLQTAHVPDSHGNQRFGRIDPTTMVFFKVPSHRALRLGKTILEISDLPAAAKDQVLSEITREERRLYNRYMMGQEDRGIRFFLNGSRENCIPILNISFKGISFLAADEATAAKLLEIETLHGEIEISDKCLQVQVRLRNQRGLVLGGSLIIEEEKLDSFAFFLAPRLLGQSLEEDTSPLEETPSSQAGVRSYLFLGIHNTHLLAQILPPDRLIRGRISFMYQVVTFEGRKLSAWTCSNGIIFPRDWELPLDSVQALPEISSHLKEVCEQILQVAKIPEEVRRSWLNVLKEG